MAFTLVRTCMGKNKLSKIPLKIFFSKLKTKSVVGEGNI